MGPPRRRDFLLAGRACQSGVGIGRWQFSSSAPRESLGILDQTLSRASRLWLTRLFVTGHGALLKVIWLTIRLSDYQYWSIHIAWISRWMYWMGFAAAGHQCERHESERDKATRLQEPSTSNCPPSRARHCHGRRWNRIIFADSRDAMLCSCRAPQERLKRLPRMNNLARDWPAVIHREDVFPFSLLPPASPSPTGITGNTQPGPYQSNHRGPMPKAHSRLHQQSRFTTLPVLPALAPSY